MLDGLFEHLDAHVGKLKKAKLAQVDLDISRIAVPDHLESLDLHKKERMTRLPVHVGDYVTTAWQGLDSDGNPKAKYRFPVPGIPGQVVAVHTSVIPEESDGTVVIEDCVVSVLTPHGVREFLMDRSSLIPWRHNMTVPAEYTAWLESCIKPSGGDSGCDSPDCKEG